MIGISLPVCSAEGLTGQIKERMSMGLITGTHHVALKCTGEAEYLETIRFYHEILGMEIIRTWGCGKGAGIMLDTGDGSRMEIFADGEERLPQGAVRHFALACSDVDEAVRIVEEAGYAVTTRPKDIVIASEIPYPARIAFVIGPTGEEIEFFCEK